MLAPYRGRRPARPCCCEHRPVRREPTATACAPSTPRPRDGRRAAAPSPRRTSSTPPSTGELLPLAGVEYVTGSEAQDEHGEPQRPDGRRSRCNMQAFTVLLRPRPPDGEDHTIDRPARVRLLARLPARLLAGPAAGLPAPDPRTLEPLDRRFDPEPRRRPARRGRRPAANPGDRTCGLPPHPRPQLHRPARTTQRHHPGQLADDRLLARPAHRRRRRERRPPPRARPGSSACRSCTGCRPRRRARTAAPASPACGCAPTSPAPPTAWRRPLHPRVAAHPGRAPRSPSSDVALDAAGAHRRRGAVPTTRSASAGTASTCTPPPAATTTSTSASVPVRDPARRAAAACGSRNLLPGRQEHRHHPHHQRLLPAAPRRVERRRGRRRAGGLLPGPRASSRTRSRRSEQLLDEFARVLDRAGVERHWPDVRGY